MKQGCILLLTLVFCCQSQGQMYQCVDPGVRVSYSDMPCEGGTEVNLAPAPELSVKTWQEQVKLKKPDGIWITDMVTNAGETTISYKFKLTAKSNEFMYPISKLSGVSMAMSHMKMPAGKDLGQAKVVVGKNVAVL